MSVQATVRETVTVLGYAFPKASTISADGAVVKEVTVAAAKTGQLTTRTDSNTGTLTMTGGHGITTGARLDLYWTGGSRRGITVGTVATNSVPIDLGAGDNLPDNLTAITAMVPSSEEFVLTGSNAAGIFLYSDIAGQVTFTLSDNTEVKSYSVGGSSGGEQSEYWTTDRDADNPLASAAVAKAYFSHGSSSASATMRAVVLFS